MPLPLRAVILASQNPVSPSTAAHSIKGAAVSSYLLMGTDKWATAGPVREVK